MYPLAIQPPGPNRRRENTSCQRRGSLDVGNHMQTALSHADSAIGAAQYARKSAAGLMAHEWAHE
jgi:hypothetical protein